MLYFIHLPVALLKKYTTHALDKLLEHAAIVNSEKVNMFLKCHQRKKNTIMWLVFYIFLYIDNPCIKVHVHRKIQL